MASLIGRPSDPIRSFFLKVDGSKMKCIDCNYLVSDKIERLRNHRKRCPAIGCSTHPEQQYDSIVESLPQPLPIPAKRPKTCQPHMSSFCIKTDSAAATQLDLQIAKFLYACNIPFNIVEHKEFKAMISLLRPGYSPPNRKELAGNLLNNVHERINEHICEQTRGKEVTLIQDGWSDIHNNPVIATSIHTGSKTYFLNAVDTGANKKTASFCAELFQKAIAEAENKFECRTVGVVTDNERQMEAMLRKLCEVDNYLITYGCSSHLLNLLGQDVTPQQIITPIVDVSKYFRNHHTPGALLSEFSEQGAVKPQIPGATRWNSQLECITIFNKNKPFYLTINAQHEDAIETRIVSILTTLASRTRQNTCKNNYNRFLTR